MTAFKGALIRFIKDKFSDSRLIDYLDRNCLMVLQKLNMLFSLLAVESLLANLLFNPRLSRSS
jgi:hypothetical protein